MEIENNTLFIYDKIKEVPKEYLKTIQAGRLKGMSDIKPQWRIMKMTEVFGPIGIGWNIENVKYTYTTIGQEVVCHCELDLFVKIDGEWSRPIHGVGGNKLATMERNGLYISDEDRKMAYTDAISVACKMLGLASDVYLGHGGKYDNENNNTQITPQNNQQNDKPWLTDKEFKGLLGKGTAEQYENAKAQRRIKKEFREQLDNKFKNQ